jgi:hypothetical protein
MHTNAVANEIPEKRNERDKVDHAPFHGLPQERSFDSNVERIYGVVRNLPIEHGGVFEHVGKYNEDNFGSSHVDLGTFPFNAVNVSNDRILDVQVHLIFRLE